MLVKNKDGWYFYIKMHNKYVNGAVGQNIKLSFRDKLNILFSKGINIVFTGSDTKVENK